LTAAAQEPAAFLFNQHHNKNGRAHRPAVLFFIALNIGEKVMNAKKSTNDLIMRAPTMDDLDACVKLFNEYAHHFVHRDEIDHEELRNFWTTPDLKMEDNLRVLVTPEGRIVGYTETTMLDPQPVHPYMWLRVHPDYLDTDVPERLMSWAVERSKAALDLCPPELRVSIQTFLYAEAKPLEPLFEKYGFGVIRYSFMMKVDLAEEPAEPQWPAGIELRPFVRERDLEAVYRAYDEAFSDHYGYIKRPFEVGLKRFSHMLLEDNAHDPDLWFVAWDGDQVAGASLCFKFASEDPTMGWLELLLVRRQWRKRGLGKALLLQTFRAFRDRGMKSTGLGVDGSNLTGALRLYESAGMKVAQQYSRYEKELRPGKELMTTDLSE
jgi:GNAT superfamily N-acetyltransferase